MHANIQILEGAETIPVDEDITEQVRWYASHAAQLAKLRKDIFDFEKSISEFIKEKGPFLTDDGLVEIQAAGYEWDEDRIAYEFPTVVKRVKVAVELPSVDDFDAVSSLIKELCPDAVIESKRMSDKALCARVIKAGGQAGKRMEELRKSKGKLGVTTNTSLLGAINQERIGG